MRPGAALAGGLAAALLATPVAATANPVAISGAVPSAHRLELRFDPRGRGLLRGTQAIELVNLGPAAVDRVWLRLWANGPEGCRPRRIAVTVEAPDAGERLRVRCTVLPVRLAQPLAPAATGTLTLRWRVSVPRTAGRFGRIGRAVLLGNVVPVPAVTDGRGLHLDPYVDSGESFYSLSSRWDATLRLPRGLRAATTGAVVSERLEGRDRVLTVSTPQARDFGLAVGRFRLLQRSTGGVRVRVHAQGRGRGGREMLRVALRAVRAFGRRFGAYGSPELDLVETPGLGMEYPELAFSEPLDFIVAHEVAHQWWYGLAGNDQYREPWLDESLASYSDATLYRDPRRCDPRRPFSSLARPFRRTRLDRSMGYFGPRPDAYSEVVYVGGACALRSLERSIGRSRMTGLLRLLVSRHRHGVVTKADVLQAISEVAPRRFDLRRFLRRAHLGP